MVEGWADPSTAAVPTPMSLEEPYEVIGIECRTATIAELWLRPRGGALEYLPGEDVLLEDRKRGFRRGRSRPPTAPRPDGLISLLSPASLIGRPAPGSTSDCASAREAAYPDPTARRR